MPSRNEELPLPVEIERTESLLRIFKALTLLVREPHAVLDLLLGAEGPESAVAALRERYDFDEDQATAVLEAQFRRATVSDRRMIEERHRELVAQIAYLRTLENPSDR